MTLTYNELATGFRVENKTPGVTHGAGSCIRCGLFFKALGKHKCIDIGPAPFCACGCGLQVRSYYSGVWSRWRPGHWQRGVQRAN